MAIEFHTIPEECYAQIFFVEGGYTGEDWQAEIEATGESHLFALTPEGKRHYTTPEQFENAVGVERFTLINHHVCWVDE